MKTCLRTMSISLVGLCLATTVHAQGSLKGVWEVQERTELEGDESTTISDPQPSLYLFTDRYYAIMFIPGTEPRPDLMVVQQQLRQASGEDLVAAFNTFVANAGTYEVSGSRLTRNIVVARIPGAMGVTADWEYEVGGDTLTITATNAAGVTTLTTLRRLE